MLAQPFPAPVGAVNVLFFSDGRPSDTGANPKELADKLLRATADSCRATVELLPEAFRFHTVGFGSGAAAKDDFQLLRAMSDSFAQTFGVGTIGQFHNSGLQVRARSSPCSGP